VAEPTDSSVNTVLTERQALEAVRAAGRRDADGAVVADRVSFAYRRSKAEPPTNLPVQRSTSEMRTVPIGNVII
jgi:hypothetical protein